MSSRETIHAVGLTRRYAPGLGVFDLDMRVFEGLILGFIGPSGSGKTTTIRLLTGIIAPDAGSVRVLGEDPRSFTPGTRSRIGYMPQDAVLHPELTLYENLRFAASLFGMSRERRRALDAVIDFVELDGAMHRLPKNASGGEKRRVTLAATLVHSPELVFLDEPTAGIDPVLRRKIWDSFARLAGEGRTLVVTTQYVGDASYCDYVAVLVGGRVAALDTPEGLRRRAYGGEMIEVLFADAPDRAALPSLERLAEGRPVEWLDRRTVRLVVDDAGSAAPRLAAWAREKGIELEKTEAYLPPFDDVFVELVSTLGQPLPSGRDVA